MSKDEVTVSTRSGVIYSRASLLPLEALKRAFSEPAPWADYQTLFFVRSAIDMAIADEEKRLIAEAGQYEIVRTGSRPVTDDEAGVRS